MKMAIPRSASRGYFRKRRGVLPLAAVAELARLAALEQRGRSENAGDAPAEPASLILEGKRLRRPPPPPPPPADRKRRAPKPKKAKAAPKPKPPPPPPRPRMPGAPPPIYD